MQQKKTHIGYTQGELEYLDTCSIIHDFPGMYGKFHTIDEVNSTGLFILADPDTYEIIGYAIFQNGRISCAEKNAVVSQNTKEHWIDGMPQDWPDGSPAIVAKIENNGTVFIVHEHWTNGRLKSRHAELMTA